VKPLDFMVIGAQKCGTTALSEFLAEHPQVEIAEGKEAHVFDGQEFQDDWSVEQVNELYMPLFADCEGTLRGEATPVYLYFPEVAARLRRYNPELKLLVLLRDPTERAYSQYRMELARGNEHLPYWVALAIEPFRLFKDRNSLADASSRRRHSYRDRGYYNRQLRNLFDSFDPTQVMIVRTEDLRENHEETMMRVFDFLEVEQYPVKLREVFSQEIPKSNHRLSDWFLRKCFRRDMEELETLVGISTEAWRR